MTRLVDGFGRFRRQKVPRPMKHDKPTLSRKLLYCSADYVSAYAVLLRYFQLVRRQLASGGYGVI
jgi:hypothetical protein